MEYGMEYGICYCKLKIMFHSLFGFGGLLFFLERCPQGLKPSKMLWYGRTCGRGMPVINWLQQVDSLANPQVLQVRVKASKTDPFHIGVDVSVGRTNCSLCPLSRIGRFLANLAKIVKSDGISH